MFSRLRVRTKILAILIPPVLGLAIFAGIAAQDRLVERADAETAVAVSNVSDAIREFSYRIQAERLHTSVAVASGQAVTDPEITALRASTDAASERLVTSANVLGLASSTTLGIDTAAVAADAVAATSAVNEVRAGAAAADADVQAVFEGYSAINAQMIDLNSVIAGRSEIPGRATQALHWAEAGAEAEARGGTAAAIGLYDTDLAEWAGQTFTEQAQLATSAFATYAVDASDVGRAALDRVLNSLEVKESNGWFEAGSEDPLSTMPGDPAAWTDLMNVRISAYATSEADLLAADRAVASQLAADADQRAKLFIGIAAFVLVAALTLAIMAARAIISNLRTLTDAARDISTQQLPDLVRALSSTEDDVSLGFEPIHIESDDEFSDVADALNALGATAAEVARQQRTTLRKGISDIFINLARRNQSLLDRQIEFIDVLEANEEDPDQLENLFRLDHLATRMRRNAESLLVLANAEPPRRRLQEVTLNDVIRVAIGEVEEYSRINLEAVDHATTNSAVAVDIAHLLSELMENGTVYSPPQTSVDIRGSFTEAHDFVISVIDRGVGMTADQVASANQLMAHPPAVGLSMNRSLGFTVVATLAARHGLGVSFASVPNEGVWVDVTVPARLLGGVVDLETPTDGLESRRVPDPIAPGSHAADLDDRVSAPPETYADPGPIADDPMATPTSAASITDLGAADAPPSAADATDPFSDLPVRERIEAQDVSSLAWNPVLDGAAPEATGETDPAVRPFEQEWAEPVEELLDPVPSWAQPFDDAPTADQHGAETWGTDSDAANTPWEPGPEPAFQPTADTTPRGQVPEIDPTEVSRAPWESDAAPSQPTDATAQASEPASWEPATTPWEPAADATPDIEPAATPWEPAADATPDIEPAATPWEPAADATPDIEPAATPWEPAADATPDIEPATTPWEPAADATPDIEPAATPWEPAADAMPDISAPATLADSLGTGQDFDDDLAALLGNDDSGGREPDPDPMESQPQAMTEDGLPQRHPGERSPTFEPPEVIGRVASPVRPPEEIRHSLSSYRAGRRSGRAASADTGPAADPATPDDERP